jgi:hypothetical protein
VNNIGAWCEVRPPPNHFRTPGFVPELAGNWCPAVQTRGLENGDVPLYLFRNVFRRSGWHLRGFGDSLHTKGFGDSLHTKGFGDSLDAGGCSDAHPECLPGSRTTSAHGARCAPRPIISGIEGNTTQVDSP